MGNGAVFAVAGSKGGVGKTTTSINLSAALVASGCEVVLVEMDLAMANVGDFLDIDVDLEGDDPTLHEVLAGTASVVEATYDSPGGFDVVPSGVSLRGFANADAEAVSGALETLRFAYDVVVFDTGAGVSQATLVPLALADETVLVSSPRVASVRDTMKTRDLTRQAGGTVAGVVFVRSGTGRSPAVDHIAEFLSVDLLGHVPEDSAVPSAQDVGRPVVVAHPESDAAAAYRDLADRFHDRLDALGAVDSAVLSTERVDRGGSGFAFLDDPAEANDGTVTGEGGGDDTTTGSKRPSAAASPSRGSPRVTDRARTEGRRGHDGIEQSHSGVGQSSESERARERTGQSSDESAPPSPSGPSAAASSAHATDVETGGDATAAAEPIDVAGEPATRAAADVVEPVEARETSDGVNAHDAADTDDTPAATGVADGGVPETRREETASEGDASAGSMRSSTRRFLDRALDLVDRRAD